MAPLHALLSEPFGSYPDKSILNPNWPRRGAGPSGRPVLTSISIRCGDEDVGLDDIESIMPLPSTNRVVKYPVLVYGALEVERLEWLSESGRELLEQDLRRRDDALSIAAKPSELTLRAVYGDGINSGSKIHVWVCFRKIMSAAYGTLEDDPSNLVLYSDDQNRSYAIKSMDVKTFSRSRNFLERYRIRKLIQELADGEMTPTPPHERTIDWIINRYLLQVAPMDRYIRIIYNPKMDYTKINKWGDVVLEQPRHPRPLHKSSLRGLIGAHAEWILADMIAPSGSSPQGRYLNIRRWIEFIRKVRAVRRIRNSNKPKGWGEPWNYDPSHVNDDIIDLTIYGGTKEEWDRKKEHAIRDQDRQAQGKVSSPLVSRLTQRQASGVEQTPAPRKKIPLPRIPKAPEAIAPLLPTSIPSKSLLATPTSFTYPKVQDIPVQHEEYDYDYDFEQDSTPPASDWESDSEEEDNIQDPLLLKEIPRILGVKPTLSSADMVWKCPYCQTYSIDMMKPTEEQLDGIPEEHARMLRMKTWRWITDLNFRNAFGYLVDVHYTEHMEVDLGIKIERSAKGKVRVIDLRPEERANQRKWRGPL